jgi:hypothetical protein
VSRALGLAALLALLCAPAVPATAGQTATPDSAARAALQRRIGRLGSVQLVGPAGSVLLLEPVVREDGLHMREPWKPPRAALFVSADAPVPPRPVEFVPWSAIEQVQVRRSGTGTGLLAGAAFGAGLSGLLALAFHGQIASNWEAGTAQPALIAGSAILVGTGALTGALLGSFGGGWHTVYPEPAPRPRP